MPAARDYHKVLRQRLRTLAERLAEAIGPCGHRVFTDSAPVLEVELAARSGIGWRGKHTLALDRDGGSMFFLGEIYVDVPLPPTDPVDAHCGSCSACIDVCPTQAIVAPYELDARRCISYLTIEHQGAIPVEFRAAMGNRIYGCDDCQLVCPWNKYARTSRLPDFDARGALAAPTLLELWAWSEDDFLRATEGSAIRRIGHERWQRNLAVALGNALHASGDPAIAEALRAGRDAATPLVREHIDWALGQAGAGPAPTGEATQQAPPKLARPARQRSACCTLSQSGTLTMPSQRRQRHQPGDEDAVAAHARRQHVGARGGRQGGEEDDHAGLRRRQGQRGDDPERQHRQGGMADRHERRRERRRRLQGAERQPGTDRHQAQGQGGQADPLQSGRRRLGQHQADAIGGEPGGGAQDQRVAGELAQVGVAAVAGQRPDRGDVAERAR
jgi:epoxyqueuosine reductase